MRKEEHSYPYNNTPMINIFCFYENVAWNVEASGSKAKLYTSPICI